MTGDWTDALEEATAYRITEIFNVDSEEARRRVREFAERGVHSEHHSQVLQAGYDLFKPILGSAIPTIRIFLQAANSFISAEIQRGRAAEEAVRG